MTRSQVACTLSLLSLAWGAPAHAQFFDPPAPPAAPRSPKVERPPKSKPAAPNAEPAAPKAEPAAPAESNEPILKLTQEITALHEKLAVQDQAISSLREAVSSLQQKSPAAEPQPAAPGLAAPIAQPAPAEPTGEAPIEAAEPLGLSFNVGWASLYNFRGYNMFQQSRQNEQNGVFSPSLTWSSASRPLSFTYAGQYQVNGANQAEKVAAGYSHEQDLIVAYNPVLLKDLLTLNTAIGYYFYPFATKAAAGASWPSFLEPMVGATLTKFVAMQLTLSYFHGVQKALESSRHLYPRLYLSHTMPLSGATSMVVGTGLAYKVRFTDAVADNRWDWVFDYKLPIAVSSTLSLIPAVHLACTDKNGAAMGEGFMAYASLDVLVSK